MSKVRAFALAALVGGFAGGAGADTLDMRGTDSASRFEEAGKPTRGMTQARVEANFGEPQSRAPAVGDPPISRWEYGDFIVYFEYDKVIHSVSRR
ncbi:MAG: hypothetical protein WD448_06245 [Woeseia sp.]